MRLLVNPHKIELIQEEAVNEKEINVSYCEFEFSDEITDDFVKEAYFTLDNTTYKQIIVDNKCSFPQEVLVKEGTIELGVVATYTDLLTDEIIRYNPTPVYFKTDLGSLKNAENSEPITPTDKEQIEQELLNISSQMDNINIEAEKVEHTTTITITRKDGTSYDVEVLDGEKGDKGDKGDAGAIKMIIVNELPATGSDDTIYLVPNDDPETGNNYDEYVYVNNAWEKLGGIQVEVDLTDYVKNTDYASSSKGGVIKTNETFGTGITLQGGLYAIAYAYSDYLNKDNRTIISKGTLENVITGKDLTTKAYVDNITGTLSSLSTTDKTNLVSAINELASSGGGITELTGGTIRPQNLTDGIYHAYNNGGVMTIYCSNNNNPTYMTTDAYLIVVNGTSGKYWYVFDQQRIVRMDWYHKEEKVFSFLLTKDNTTSYTPTGDYNPATKKYVDDSIASAITTTLGGSF